MKTWMPFTISFILAIIINVLPIVPAAFFGENFWEIGILYYIETIPIGIFLMLVGLIISLVLFFKRRSA